MLCQSSKWLPYVTHMLRILYHDLFGGKCRVHGPWIPVVICMVFNHESWSWIYDQGIDINYDALDEKCFQVSIMIVLGCNDVQPWQISLPLVKELKEPALKSKNIFVTMVFHGWNIGYYNKFKLVKAFFPQHWRNLAYEENRGVFYLWYNPPPTPIFKLQVHEKKKILHQRIL